METKEFEYMPRWIMKRLKMLWEKFGEDEFSFDDAAALLKDDNERVLAVVLSRLVKSGWLISERKKEKYGHAVYKIKDPKAAQIISRVRL